MTKKQKDKLKFIGILIIALILFLVLIEKTSFLDLLSSDQESSSLDQSIGENLEVHFIDVGQGDSALIKNGQYSMLIDGGISGASEKLVGYLKANQIEKLDYVIATHPHEDHIGGLNAVFENFKVDKIIMPNVSHTTKTFERLLDNIMAQDLQISEAVSGDKYSLGSSEFLILAPNSEKYSNLNDYSVSIKLDHKNTSFILTGDAEKTSELEMVNKYGSFLSADVLKLGHHGSRTSSSEEFVGAVSPSIAVISVGQDNKYGLPNEDVVERLESYGAEIYQTSDLGDIVIISNGDKLVFKDGKTYEGKSNSIVDSIIYFIKLFIDE